MCRHLAAFCSTVSAYRRCAAQQVEIGESLERCACLQQETQEAVSAQCSFDGISDLAASLAPIRTIASGGGQVALHPRHVVAIATTLQAALHIRQQLVTEQADTAGQAHADRMASGSQASTSTAASQSDAEKQQQSCAKQFPMLSQHAQRIAPQLQGVVDMITDAIDIQSAIIQDTASAALRETRQAKAKNAEALSKEMDHWCKLLHKSKASDVVKPLVRRGRSCCSIKRGNTGVRLYMHIYQWCMVYASWLYLFSRQCAA
jgi:hypothetical protein